MENENISCDVLSNKKCIPCEAGTLPMKGDEIKKYMSIVSGWELQEDTKIKKEFKFKDFKESMKFVNKVADLAESEGHHPSIFISYNKVKITLFTHAISGLSENDFIMATKIDKV